MRYFKRKIHLVNYRESIKVKKTELPFTRVSTSLLENVNHIEKLFSHSHDLKNFQFNLTEKKCVVLYFETLVDMEKLEKKLFTPISKHKNQNEFIKDIPEPLTKLDNFEEVTEKLLNGFSIFYVDGEQYVYCIDVASRYERTTDEPENEKVIRGSHQGFVENLTTNLNLIRKRIEHKDLLVKYLTLGNKTKTKVAILYMKGIANEEVVNEVQRRLMSIDTDMIFNTGFIEEFIEDSHTSLFPQMLNTERPDRVTANLMEGRISLLSDGVPTALILPVTFFSFYQSPDDYGSRAYFGSFIRIIRLISFLIAITLPAIYIAVIGFHFEVLPEELIITVKSSVEKIPYPTLIEALIMELTIELIRESGIRLPGAIGPTIGIVGGLVIGDAVVRAGLVSNTMIVIVAITAIASYVVPSNEMGVAIRLIRFPMMIAAATFGFVGIVFGLMILLIHLCKLESFGTPYFAPVAPFHWKDLKDSIVRLPVWKLKKDQQN